MGERLRWVVSVDEETQLLAERWQAQFSPLVGANRSSLVRLVFKTLDRLGMTASNVLAALSYPQGLTEANGEQPVIQGHNLSHEVVPKKPCARVTTPQEPSEGSRTRRRFGSVSRLQVVSATGASPSRPFPADVRRLFAIPRVA